MKLLDASGATRVHTLARPGLAQTLLRGPWAITRDALQAHYELVASGVLSSRAVIAEMAPRIREREKHREAAAAVRRGDASAASSALWAVSDPTFSAGHDPHILADAKGLPAVGVLPHSDVMMTSAGLCWEGYDTRTAYGRAMLSEGVHTIAMVMNTPGGQCQGGIEYASEIRSWRAAGVRVVAIVSHMACSMGYWIASQADEIVITPSAIIGHMGAFSDFTDITGALAKAGIRHGYISEGEGKTAAVGDDTETDPAEQDAARDRVMRPITQHFYNAFLADVGKGRGQRLTAARARQLGAMLYPGNSPAGDGLTAIQAGLADHVGTLETALTALVAGAELEAA